MKTFANSLSDILAWVRYLTSGWLGLGVFSVQVFSSSSSEVRVFHRDVAAESLSLLSATYLCENHNCAAEEMRPLSPLVSSVFISCAIYGKTCRWNRKCDPWGGSAVAGVRYWRASPRLLAASQAAGRKRTGWLAALLKAFLCYSLRPRQPGKRSGR